MLFTDDFMSFLQDPFKYKHRLTQWKARRKFLQNHHKLKKLTEKTEVWAVQSEESDNPLSSSEDEQPILLKPRLSPILSVETPRTKPKGRHSLLDKPEEILQERIS